MNCQSFEHASILRTCIFLVRSGFQEAIRFAFHKSATVQQRDGLRCTCILPHATHMQSCLTSPLYSGLQLHSKIVCSVSGHMNNS